MTSWLVFFLYLRGAVSLEARARFFLLAICDAFVSEWGFGVGLFVAWVARQNGSSSP